MHIYVSKRDYHYFLLRFVAEPLPESMLNLCQLYHWEQISVTFESKHSNSHTGIYRLQNGRHSFMPQGILTHWFTNTLRAQTLAWIRVCKEHLAYIFAQFTGQIILFKATSHYRNQWWSNVNYTLRNKLQWNSIWNSKKKLYLKLKKKSIKCTQNVICIELINCGLVMPYGEIYLG